MSRYAVLAAIVFALVACHHNSGNGRMSHRAVVNPEFNTMSKDALFQKGEEWFAKKKYAKARTYFSYIYENSPNDPLGRRALLRVADTYYAQNDPVNLVEAQYKYRDFLNRYPGSDRADYALLQIANVSYKQMERPDRDQAKTHEAVDKYNDMIKTYPKSSLRPEADKKLQDAIDRLAKHEHIVARYYMKRHSFDSAVRRLNGMVEQYPNYYERDAVYFDLGTSLDALGRKPEARLYFERVVSEFPKSQYADRARKHLELLKA